MTTLVRVPQIPAPPSPAPRQGRPVGVLLAVLVVVAGRLPFLHSALSSDESGFLTVGGQWHSAGHSLYGNYWVDRPPLLVSIFRAASLLGGVIPLRLIGILAAAVAVLAVGSTVRRHVGNRASTWAAFVVAALSVSPLAGAMAVNGELLAAPFVAVGVAAVLRALTASAPRRTLLWSLLAGACGTAAVLVKQNMLDVGVVAVVLLALTTRRMGWRRTSRTVAGLVSGGALVVGVTTWWTVVHGTSLSAVWFAMYRFRIEAARITAPHPSPTAALREQLLLVAAVSSGLVLVLGLAVLLARRNPRTRWPVERRREVTSALPGTLICWLAYDVLSIDLGGSFWGHYLVQLAVPLGLVVGLGAAHLPRLTRLVACYVGVVATAATIFAAAHPNPGREGLLGAAIGSASHRGDSIVTVWGHAGLTRASGLPSPYPYLWYLPTIILDPHLSHLTATLEGPRAPTWFVAWSGTRSGRADTTALNATLRRHYYVVSRTRGSTVYLHDGAQRAPIAGHLLPHQATPLRTSKGTP